MKTISMARRGDWNALDTYLREVAAMPQLTEAEDAAAGARAFQGEVSAQAQLVEAHLRLVVRIAHQYAGFGLPLADIISEGNIGLIRAAELYNPGFGTKFATYASVWIKQRIHRAITSQARVVRIPIWRSQRLRKLTRLNDELSSQLGRNATGEELGERLGLSAEQIASLQGDRVQVISLDAPAQASDESETPLHEAFPDENAVHPAQRLGERELVDEIMSCLHELDDRELEILSLKHGFHPQGDVSFRQLGRRLGVSHEWVRRIAELAIVKARRALEKGRALPARERELRKERVLQRIRALSAVPA
jgi:RNA polymerase primary sigma factor